MTFNFKGSALYFVYTLASFCLFGCGPTSNSNQIWGHSRSVESQLVEAKVAFDQGKFDRAIQITKSLLETNPNHEEAAIVQGYAYLSQGGLDPFRVASCLIEDRSSTAGQTADSKSRCNSTSVDDKAAFSIDESIEEWFVADSPALDANSSGEDDASFLIKLQTSLLKITKEEFEKLRKGEFSGNSQLFSGTNSLVIPVEVTQDLRDEVGILNYTSSSIKSVCSFINDTEILKSDDSRYKALECAPTPYSRRLAAKAHYLWAISHLGEILTYSSVILYNTGGGSSFNFKKAANQLASQSTNEPEKIVSAVEDINQAIGLIFDTENSKSMISQTLYSLNSLSAAFDAISGLPSSVKTNIQKIIDGVKNAGKAISGVSSETRALKTRLLESVTTSVAKKINETITGIIKAAGGDPNNITAASIESLPDDQKMQVKKLCSSYDSLTKDSTQDKREGLKPKACS